MEVIYRRCSAGGDELASLLGRRRRMQGRSRCGRSEKGSEEHGGNSGLGALLPVVLDAHDTPPSCDAMQYCRCIGNNALSTRN